ncbi:MAG: hypothetical protein ABJC12_12120, partial [Saprospiraceae bacterium]
MKRFFTHFASLFFPVILFMYILPAHGQSITISEELALRNDYDYTILGWVSGDLLLFRDRGHQFFIQAFDEELHLKWEREVSLGPHKADIIGVVSHPDRIDIIYGIREKGDYYLKHRSYDHSITLIDTMTLGIVENIFITPHVQLAHSDDEGKVVLYREDSDGLHVLSYDLNSQKVLWLKSLKIPGGIFQRDFTSVEVSNTGDFYLTVEPDKFMQKIQSLDVYSFVSGSAEISHETIDMGDQQVYDYYTQFDNLHSDLVITGLYSDHNVSRAQGFYFVRYQPGINQNVHLLPFDESLLSEVNGKDVAISRGLSDFNV